MNLRAAGLRLLVCAPLAGCAGFQHVPWIDSQRWPEPMESTRKPLPPGDATLYPPGPEEVRIIRHADPVHVRAAGSAGSVPLSYHRKDLRVASGSGVTTSGEGRAEVLFEGGSSVVLYGRCDAIVGSPSRGEPSLVLREIEQARFDPVAEDLYELAGGARLRVRDGPVRVTRVRDDVLRISNESKRSAQVAYLDETIVLDPGQAVRLPLLSSGARPLGTPEELADAAGPGFHARHASLVQVSAESGDLLARGEGEIRALGVRVKLAPGTQARFRGLGRRADAAAAAEKR